MAAKQPPPLPPPSRPPPYIGPPYVESRRPVLSMVWPKAPPPVLSEGRAVLVGELGPISIQDMKWRRLMCSYLHLHWSNLKHRLQQKVQEKVQLLFWKRGIFWATQAIARIIDGGPPPVKARSQCIHHFASDGPNTAQSQPCFSDLAPPCIEGN